MGYRPSEGDVRGEVHRLVDWASGGSVPPEAVATLVVPGRDEIVATHYRQRWRVKRFLTFMSRRDLRDLLTGERLEVERHFGARLEVHHLYPSNWLAATHRTGMEADASPT
jgi:hypothetical protein